MPKFQLIAGRNTLSELQQKRHDARVAAEKARDDRIAARRQEHADKRAQKKADDAAKRANGAAAKQAARQAAWRKGSGRFKANHANYEVGSELQSAAPPAAFNPPPITVGATPSSASGGFRGGISAGSQPNGWVQIGHGGTSHPGSFIPR